MTKPMLLAEFPRLPPVVRASVGDGLVAAIDLVADAAPASHGFLRYGWYAAALAAYGGQARTVVVEEDGLPVLALPLVAQGPGWAGLHAIPGSYWPFRSFPMSHGAGDAALRAALAAIAGFARAVRIGPVGDDDPAAAPLVAAARAAGWTVLDRHVAHSWVLDLAAARAAGDWPRNSTLRKNRFHEKHLAAHGALDWQMVDPADWADAFAAMAAIERDSWIAARTDGRDAKFTAEGHGAFWRAAAADPVLAGMFHAALLRIDGRPAAFSFDIDAGRVRYAVANSYDPAFAKHSPGKLLYYRNLVDAIGRGVACVDWGAGDSGYKQVLGATRGAAIRDWLLVRPGLSAQAAKLAAGLWRRSGNPVVRSAGDSPAAR